MEREADRWKQICVATIESVLCGIILIPQIVIQAFICLFFFILSTIPLIFLIMSSMLGSIFLYRLLYYVSSIQLWDRKLDHSNLYYIRSLYARCFKLLALAIFFMIIPTLLDYQDGLSIHPPWVFLKVLALGGGSLPLYLYCAQFLFQPRPRLRFISSLLLIPACVLWIWYLLAFWAGL